MRERENEGGTYRGEIVPGWRDRDAVAREQRGDVHLLQLVPDTARLGKVCLSRRREINAPYKREKGG